MVVGSFGKLMSRYFINIRVVDVETGNVVFSDSAKGDTVDAIEIGVDKVANSIINSEGGSGEVGEQGYDAPGTENSGDTGEAPSGLKLKRKK